MPSQKRGRLGVLCSKSPPSYSRGNRHQFPPKKEEAWVFSAASHIQAIREAININALPKKRKLGCSLLQVTSKLFKRKPTSIPSQKRGSLGVLCRKSPPSNSRGNKHHLPPKKEEAWVFSAASHIQAIREAININAPSKNGEARWRRRQC